MANKVPQRSSIGVYARWRPLAEGETESAKGRPETDFSAFKAILQPEDDNVKAYETIVASSIPKVLQGGSCGFFAYGHTGSGKTHTIIGYNTDHDEGSGLCLSAARRLFQELESINEKRAIGKLGIGLSMFELRRKLAFDLLNNHTECYVREGGDHKVHIRGETEILEGGKVRVRPIVKRPCWTFDIFRQELVQGLKARSVGTSTVHEQSSRTHAILELEIVSQELVDAREALIDRQSELVPVGKHATDISIEEQLKAIIRNPEGRWEPNPNYQVDHARIDAAEAEKSRCEARVTAAEEHIERIIAASASPCLGAKMIFVDLAGAEYYQEKGTQLQTSKQTPQERQEGRQINTDLLTLKEVIRARSNNESRLPFRSSTLTMVLREHFNHINSENNSSTMILTLSPAQEHYAATLNSLKYGTLVAKASS